MQRSLWLISLLTLGPHPTQAAGKTRAPPRFGSHSLTASTLGRPSGRHPLRRCAHVYGRRCLLWDVSCAARALSGGPLQVHTCDMLMHVLQVVEGMDVVDKFYSGYGDMKAFGGSCPDSGRMMQEGNAYVKCGPVHTRCIPLAVHPSKILSRRCMAALPISGAWCAAGPTFPTFPTSRAAKWHSRRPAASWHHSRTTWRLDLRQRCAAASPSGGNVPSTDSALNG